MAHISGRHFELFAFLFNGGFESKVYISVLKTCQISRQTININLCIQHKTKTGNNLLIIIHKKSVTHTGTNI